MSLRTESFAAGPMKTQVLHVVGQVTDEVLSFLGPTTKYLASRGVSQVVVMIDDLRFRHHLLSLDESADLLLVSRNKNIFRQWLAMRQACARVLSRSAIDIVHMHGILPRLVTSWSLRGGSAVPDTIYSPHASRSLGRWRVLGFFVSGLSRMALRSAQNGAIVNMPREAQAIGDFATVEVVESPVAAAFFGAVRHESVRPSVVTSGRRHNPRGVEIFAQLAVLMSSDALGVEFSCIGAVDPISRIRLQAAGVQVRDAMADAELAASLGAAWIYVAPGGTRGFPIRLAEAMAAGMPCVAFDCVEHRSMIRHGETGLLCKTEHDFLQCVATLIDEPTLRARLANAGRQEAMRRFSELNFEARLLSAYSCIGEESVPRAEKRPTECGRAETRP